MKCAMKCSIKFSKKCSSRYFIAVQIGKTALRALMLICIACFVGQAEHHITEAQQLLKCGCLNAVSPGRHSLEEYYDSHTNDFFAMDLKIVAVGVGLVFDVVELVTKLRLCCYPPPGEIGNSDGNDNNCCGFPHEYESTNTSDPDDDDHNTTNDNARAASFDCRSRASAEGLEHGMSILGLLIIIVDVVFSFWHCMQLVGLQDIIHGVFKTQTSWCYSCEGVAESDEILSSFAINTDICYALTAIVIGWAMITLIFFLCFKAEPEEEHNE